MKKNMLTVFVAAATCINLILTIVMVFAIVPAMSKTNTLVTKIASVVDLQIDSQNKEKVQYSVDDLEAAELAFKSKQTINLKPVQGDEKSHYAILESVTISYNTKADDYDKVKSSVDKSPVYIQDIVKDVICGYTVKDLNEQKVREVSLKRVQEFYKSKSIVNISLGGFLFT